MKRVNFIECDIKTPSVIDYLELQNAFKYAVITLHDVEVHVQTGSIIITPKKEKS